MVHLDLKWRSQRYNLEILQIQLKALIFSSAMSPKVITSSLNTTLGCSCPCSCLWLNTTLMLGVGDTTIILLHSDISKKRYDNCILVAKAITTHSWLNRSNRTTQADEYFYSLVVSHSHLTPYMISMFEVIRNVSLRWKRNITVVSYPTLSTGLRFICHLPGSGKD